ncbi:CLUMA_CG009388, isoform A [Clunio marinus]|uniref:CLUMA_CG009388, isoform A n=1 Tax=Clunio marinus TaxID=568069 RepID=A0A1J1I6Q9_9DIPT|nr:CLUMA_CG009388, isoform A [Clunio marinus]
MKLTVKVFVILLFSMSINLIKAAPQEKSDDVCDETTEPVPSSGIPNSCGDRLGACMEWCNPIIRHSNQDECPDGTFCCILVT